MLKEEARLVRGSRVRYRGANGLDDGATGNIVSEVPTRMDVTPFATPPTMPEPDIEACVDVDFEEVGHCRVAVADLVIDEP